MKHFTFLGLVTAALAVTGCATKDEPAPTAVVEVQVAKAELANVQLTVSAPATIFPKEQANIAARITAPIQKLLAGKGDSVRAGQVLAELQKNDLEAQHAEMLAAVTDAEANLQKVAEGTAPTDLEHARGQVATTKAALDQAQKFYDRRRDLFDKGAIPNRDLATSETDLAQAKTAWDVAQKSLDLLQRYSSERDTQIWQSRLEQARARLAQNEAQLGYTEIKSPLSGTITEQFMWSGDMANPAAPIFTAMDLSTVEARGQVPEADAPRVREGQRCSFTPPDQPLTGTRYEGRISVLNHAVDPARRTVEAWCEIPNSGGALRGGAFGSVTIMTSQDNNSIVVPEAAVQFSDAGAKAAVLVVTSQSTAQRKDVEAGVLPGGKVQIRKGLAAGETVILTGGYGLPDGTAVKILAEKKAGQE
jgi:HlyD family secretion protein